MIQGFSNCYTFRLSIERNEDAILDIVIGANDIPDEIDKAKKTIQRLLNNYTPSFKKLEPKPEPAPEPTKLETASTPPKEPDGAQGLVTIYCKECGSAFSTLALGILKRGNGECSEGLHLVWNMRPGCARSVAAAAVLGAA